MSVAEKDILSRRGIIRIEIPSPFSSVTTNSYYIDADVPTLIDSGLATGAAYDALASALSAAGREIRDIGRIVLTHGHADHRALATRIVEESGAEVFCHPLEADKTVSGPGGGGRSRRDWRIDYYRSQGVPEEDLPRMADSSRDSRIAPRPYSASFIEEGDEIALNGFSLRVLHTPGHSCGSICLHDEEAGLIFTGDTILPDPHITAMIEVEMIREDPAYNGLKLHVESLGRLLDLEASWVLPGHGWIFDEYGAIVETLFERHTKRRRHIMRSLRKGPRTPYQICRSIFPLLSPEDLFMALSEVLGNLGILSDEGKVSSAQNGELVLYGKI